MIDFIERLVLKWTKATPKQTYLKLLEQFDHPTTTMVILPQMLIEFWKRVEPKHFQNGPSVRDMMYIDLETRHENIGELVRLLTLVTGALIQEDDETVIEIAKEQFAIKRNTTMDDYFGGVGVGSVSYIDGVRIIQTAINNHGRNIETLNPSYHSRVLNRMYNDILTVTRAIINNLPEDK